MSGFEQSDAPKIDTFESVSFCSEPPSASYRIARTPRVKRPALSVLEAVVALSVLTFLIAQCAIHLNRYDHWTASSRRLAYRQSLCLEQGERPSAEQSQEAGQISDQEELPADPPPYEEGPWFQLPSYEQEVGNRQDEQPATRRPGSAGILRRSASRVASAMRTAFRGPSRRASTLFRRGSLRAPFSYSFPHIDDERTKSCLNTVLGFLRNMNDSDRELEKRKFATVFCGVRIELTVTDGFASRGWPRREHLLKFAEGFEGSILQLLAKLAANPSLSSCQAKVSVRTVSGIEIRGDVSVIVLALRPPPYS